MINELWKLVPIPQLMLDLERDPRGMPVPYVVLKDKEGKHHFKINDTDKSILCMVQSLCGICGKPLKQKDTWMIGGIGSAFDDHGKYVDLPVHGDCGRYALQVCPYMVVRNYNGKVDIEKMEKNIPGVKLHNTTVDQDRLPLFVLIQPDGYQIEITPTGFYVVPKRKKPYLGAEFWVDGKKLTDIWDVRLRLFATKWEVYLPKIEELWKNLSLGESKSEELMKNS